MIPTAHTNVPLAREPLTLQAAEEQVRRGIREVYRGEPFPLPIDKVSEISDFKRGSIGRRPKTLTYLNREFWRRDAQGRVHRPGVRFSAPDWPFVRKAWDAADKATGGRARPIRNMLLTGSPQIDLRMVGSNAARHWHRGWANPFTGEVEAPLDATFQTIHATHWPADYKAGLRRELIRVAVPELALSRQERSRKRAIEKVLAQLPDAHDNCRLGALCPASSTSWAAFRLQIESAVGFVEDLGWLANALVTDAFVSEIVDELVSTTSSEFADFDFHEVGTSATAENNNQTALVATSGIARATGAPTDSDPDYVNVATITADATETWEEHGIFNNSTSVAMMDRNLTGGQAVNSSDQVEYTYTLTVNPEV